MDYDPSGNLLAMKRYRSAGTLIDNLTYQYTSGTNKLNYTDDAISTTTETWDAEDGSSGAFTYDANGAMTALPAPYSVTSVTYDPRGMATKVIASGNTTYYRYNSAGERYWKKTTSTTDYYALDGALQLGVFSSAGTLRHWNVIAGGRVVGRYDGSVKKYYHSDHLGTTRSVVEGSCTGGSCTIREARDYDAWGIELDGRTYLSGTAAIEGFTGKERDSETGLDYFGARYYMPSVGRWNAVDPMADKYPGWSPYNYVLNNPLMLVDPDGMMVDDCCKTLGYSLKQTFGSFKAGFDGLANKLGFEQVKTAPPKVYKDMDAVRELSKRAAFAATGVAIAATGGALLAGAGSTAATLSAIGGTAGSASTVFSGIEGVSAAIDMRTGGPSTLGDVANGLVGGVLVGGGTSLAIKRSLNNSASSLLAPTGFNAKLDLSLSMSKGIVLNFNESAAAAIGGAIGFGAGALIDATQVDAYSPIDPISKHEY